ncbi:hypothetical protein CA54_33900 [Symmachiella macrocystis]|uniref:Uncharacterized protein n=1 Tax=Symmachiella macrocystis TaxID=2527985 RepID=A0A5C6BQP5_9PLAN|nr:hypothetical protein CA54_33900 [Symmachiella macrocystis]
MLDKPLTGFCRQVRASVNQIPNLLPSDVLCTLGNTPVLRIAVFPLFFAIFRVPPGVLC